MSWGGNLPRNVGMPTSGVHPVGSFCRQRMKSPAQRVEVVPPLRGVVPIRQQGKNARCFGITPYRDPGKSSVTKSPLRKSSPGGTARSRTQLPTPTPPLLESTRSWGRGRDRLGCTEQRSPTRQVLRCQSRDTSCRAEKAGVACDTAEKTSVSVVGATVLDRRKPSSIEAKISDQRHFGGRAGGASCK